MNTNPIIIKINDDELGVLRDFLTSELPSISTNTKYDGEQVETLENLNSKLESGSNILTGYKKPDKTIDNDLEDIVNIIEHYPAGERVTMVTKIKELISDGLHKMLDEQKKKLDDIHSAFSMIKPDEQEKPTKKKN